MEHLIYPVSSLIGVSILTEAVVEIIKSVISPKYIMNENLKRIIACLVSMILAIILQVSIIDTTGISYYVGAILAGLIASRGSNFVHEFSKVIENIPAKIKR